MKIKETLLQEAVEATINTPSTWGFCLSCGEQQEVEEQDTQYATCSTCGKHEVFGVIHILYVLKGEKK